MVNERVGAYLQNSLEKKMAKRTAVRRLFGGIMTPTSKFQLSQLDLRNHWSRFEQENIPFDKSTLVPDGPYRPNENRMDR